MGWAAGSLSVPSALAQGTSARVLHEAGKYAEAVAAVESLGEEASRADYYVVGQSLSRMDRRDEARDAFRKLEAGDEDAWTFVGRSAVAVLDGDFAAALEHARMAVELDGGLFHAHYQIGLVRSLMGDYGGAAAAFERATAIDGGQAYAHYYAGLAFNKARKIDAMTRHFEVFVTLAPQAPERPQVEAILRTLRK